MRIFDHFPEDTTCPICGKNTDGPTTLIGIAGTIEGHNQEAMPVHVECLDLQIDTRQLVKKIIYQFVD